MFNLSLILILILKSFVNTGLMSLESNMPYNSSIQWRRDTLESNMPYNNSIQWRRDALGIAL